MTTAVVTTTASVDNSSPDAAVSSLRQNPQFVAAIVIGCVMFVLSLSVLAVFFVWQRRVRRRREIERQTAARTRNERRRKRPPAAESPPAEPPGPRSVAQEDASVSAASAEAADKEISEAVQPDPSDPTTANAASSEANGLGEEGVAGDDPYESPAADTHEEATTEMREHSIEAGGTLIIQWGQPSQAGEAVVQTEEEVVQAAAPAPALSAEHRAATRIQSVWRARPARIEREATLYAVRVIQRSYRRYRLRRSYSDRVRALRRDMIDRGLRTQWQKASDARMEAGLVIAMSVFGDFGCAPAADTPLSPAAPMNPRWVKTKRAFLPKLMSPPSLR